MSVAEKPESTVSCPTTPATSCWSVIGLSSPLALTAVASTRRNSWSRRMRARSLCASWGQ